METFVTQRDWGNPANIIMLGQRWPNVCSYVGTTSHANVGSTLFCSLGLQWPNRWRQSIANVQPMLIQRWPNVIRCNCHCTAVIQYVGPSLGQCRTPVLLMGVVLRPILYCINTLYKGRDVNHIQFYFTYLQEIHCWSFLRVRSRRPPSRSGAYRSQSRTAAAMSASVAPCRRGFLSVASKTT